MNKLFLVVSLVLVGLVSKAAEPIVVFTSETEKIFTVSLSEFTGDVEVTIFNWMGENVFENEFSVAGINSKTFDANSLPDGKYVFIIKDNVKEKATPFEIKKGSIDFRSSLSTMTYSPGIQQFGNQVHVNALTGENNTIQISVEDSSNVVVFSKSYKTDITFGKILDLSTLPSGFYVVRVDLNNRDFAKTIEIK